MTFEAAYRELERAFECQVEEDNRHFSSQRIVYIPNIRPEGLADYILVGSEPSFGGWASDMEQAREKIENGYKNFATSFEDFIFHYCVRTFLCQNDQTYYLTDLSKGAMKIRDAKPQRVKRYEKWLPLLKEELRLTVKPGAPVIAIGEETWKFLSKKSKAGFFEGHAVTPVLHFGGHWISNWSRYAEAFREFYDTFSPTIGLKDILSAAETTLHKAGMDYFREETLQKIRKGVEISESMKQLAFTYQISFESIRRGCFHTSWRDYKPVDSR